MLVGEYEENIGAAGRYHGFIIFRGIRRKQRGSGYVNVTTQGPELSRSGPVQSSVPPFTGN